MEKYQDEYFDDCPICTYVKSKEDAGEPLDYEELQEAFSEAEKVKQKA